MTAPGSRILREYRRGLLLASADFDRGGAVGVSSARWKGARRMDAIHRALSSFGGPLSDCARSTRSDFAIGGPKRHNFHIYGLSCGFLLGLATLAATAAAILGWCLGRSGGYSGPLVTQHMWGGVLLTLTCWLCWVLRPRLSQSETLFGIPLAIAVVLVAWTGYRGGQLSLGADHLTEHMPAGLRHVLGVSDRRHGIVKGRTKHVLRGTGSAHLRRSMCRLPRS